jgi:hypothetical protein
MLSYELERIEAEENEVVLFVRTNLNKDENKFAGQEKFVHIF